MFRAKWGALREFLLADFYMIILNSNFDYFLPLIFTLIAYHFVVKNLLHSLGLVYKSMRGMMTNSIDRDQWLNVTSESRDRI
jgi:hypothetical protein